MTPKTKLKVAAEEIKDILRKHDIAASIALHTPGHGEFINHLNPSYSCVYQYDDNELRIHSKREKYNSLAEQLDHQENTANMLRMLAEMVGHNYMTIEPISARFDKAVNAEHNTVTG